MEGIENGAVKRRKGLLKIDRRRGYAPKSRLDMEIQNTLNYDIPTSVSKTRAWFQKTVMDNTRREFSIYTVDENKYIGFCGIFGIEIPAMKAEMHCVIGDKEYQHGGYGTEAYRLLQDYGFEELGLNRIYGYQLIHNAAAHRVVEKLGWKREGLLRQDVYSHGKLHDRYIVAILKEDWEKLYEKH